MGGPVGEAMKSELKTEKPAPITVRIALAVLFVTVGAFWYATYFSNGG